MMSGYYAKGYRGFLTYGEWLKINEDEKMSVSEIMNGQLNNDETNNNNENKEINTMEENKNLSLDAILGLADKKVDDIKSDADMLEGKALKEIFGKSADIEKVGTQFKAGTKSVDGKVNVIVRFKEFNGKSYFMYLNGSAKEKMQIMIDTAGSEAKLNSLIAERGLKACFGNQVFESVDDNGNTHTNVKVWFELA